MLRFLASLLPRFASRRDLELAYLNQAVSLYDLERREIDVANGRFAGC